MYPSALGIVILSEAACLEIASATEGKNPYTHGDLAGVGMLRCAQHDKHAQDFGKELKAKSQ